MDYDTTSSSLANSAAAHIGAIAAGSGFSLLDCSRAANTRMGRASGVGNRGGRGLMYGILSNNRLRLARGGMVFSRNAGVGFSSRLINGGVVVARANSCNGSNGCNCFALITGIKVIGSNSCIVMIGEGSRAHRRFGVRCSSSGTGWNEVCSWCGALQL